MVDKYNWPAYIVLNDVGEGDWYKQCYPILYEMSEHQTLSVKICLQARPCHNPFQPWSKEVLPCFCNADDSLKREADRLREETALLSAQVQQERRSRAQTDRALINSLPDPSTIPCSHLEAGRCNGKDKCKFLHTEEALERAKTRRCCLIPKGPKCVAGDKCYYYPHHPESTLPNRRGPPGGSRKAPATCKSPYLFTPTFHNSYPQHYILYPNPCASYSISIHNYYSHH